MRRLAWLVLAGALAAGAVVVPEPEAVEPPGVFEIAAGRSDATSFAGVWYCPVAVATLERDTLISVAATERATAAFTFPNPVPGEEAETARFELDAPGALSVLVSDVALRGDAPGLIEFTTRSAASFAEVVEEAGRSGDVCLAAAPKVWYVVGNSTGEGERLTLRLFNPFPEPAKLRLLAFSEIGIEPLPEVQSITISARSWRDFPLDDALRFRDSLAFTISAEEGLAFPAVLVGDDIDTASWPGTRLADTWEFAAARVAGLTPRLVVANPGEDDLTATLDVFTAEGGQEEALTIDLPATTPTVVPLEGLTDAPFGLRVRASGPVAAALIASGPAGLGGTVGRATQATTWLLPGGDSNPDGVSTVWLLNSGESQATVTVQPLGVQIAATKLIVPPRTVRQVIADAESSGYLVESTAPVTAGWTAEGPEGVTFTAGAPLTDQ